MYSSTRRRWSHPNSTIEEVEPESALQQESQKVVGSGKPKSHKRGTPWQNNAKGETSSPACGGGSNSLGSAVGDWEGYINVWATFYAPNYGPVANKYEAGVLWDLSDPASDETKKFKEIWGTYDVNGQEANFHYIETYQIIAESAGQVDFLVWNNVPLDATYWDRYCLHYKNQYWGEKAWDSQNPVSVTVDEENPAHFTVLLCNGNGEVYPDFAFAIWVSVRELPPTSDYQVNIKQSVGYDNAGSQSDWDALFSDGHIVATDPSLFARPNWYINSDGYLGYYGSLVNLGSVTGAVDIVLDDGVNLDIPITSTYWNCIQVGKNFWTVDNNYQTDLENYIQGLNGAFAYKDVWDSVLYQKVKWSGFDLGNCAKGADISAKLYIRGYGLVNGFNLANKDSWGTDPPYGDNIVSETATLEQVLQYIEFQILSGLIEVSSSYSNGDSASVELRGVGTAYAPKRYKGAIEVNSYYMLMNSYDNNHGAVLFDVKTPGTWLDGSDGPEVMGGVNNYEKSYLGNCWLHIADDSLKMSASFWRAEEITLFQGNVGGIANIGAYGKARNFGLPYDQSKVLHMSASNLYVHRITQGGEQTFDNKGGMVVTRNGCYGNEIRDVVISGIYVPSLGGIVKPGGDAGLMGPNTIFRWFSLGFDCVGDFAATSPQNSNMFGISIISSNIYVEPLESSLFYNYPDTSVSELFMSIAFLYCDCSNEDGNGVCLEDRPCENPTVSPWTYANYADSAPRIYRAADDSAWYTANGLTPPQETYASSGGSSLNVDFDQTPGTDMLQGWRQDYAYIPV
jgi:hypothetical protein